MRAFDVSFYQREDGSEPAKEFILSQDKKMMAKTFRMVEILAANGTDLREPYSKALGDGIFELRVQVASDISRILYFFYIGKEIVLTNGFVKKTQKTPPAEIERAKQYRADYLRRRENRNE